MVAGVAAMVVGAAAEAAVVATEVAVEATVVAAEIAAETAEVAAEMSEVITDITEVVSEAATDVLDISIDFIENNTRYSLFEQSGEAANILETAEGAEATDVTKIDCRNEKLEGDVHPETGVPYERKQIEVNGETIEGVFPEFDSVFDIQLPEDILEASDATQFKECNSQLKEAIKNDPELRSKFTETQLQQIEDGITPKGYTWHHNEEVGKMQLVDADIHAKTGHTGGRAVWGGGTDNR